MAKISSVSFSSICPTINYSFELVDGVNSICPEVLIVTFTGKYRNGAKGDPDAIFMRGIINCAVDLWSPQSVLLDLSDFEYIWGDYIDYIFDEPNKKPLVTVIGPKCREALSTLVNGLYAKKDIVDNKSFFESREQAYESLQNKLNHIAQN